MCLAKLFPAFSITLLAFALSALLQNHTVYACSCVVPPAPLTSLGFSKAVFAGQVTNIDVPGGLIQSSGDPVKVSFDVSQSWKGPTGKNITVSTPRSGASCGYGFQAGQEYLVYARGDNNDLLVSLCSRTKLLAYASDDLSVLAEGSSPSEEAGLPAKQPFGFSPMTLAITGLALFVTVILAGIGHKIRSTRGRT